jgi:hypothetical protein
VHRDGGAGRAKAPERPLVLFAGASPCCGDPPSGHAARAPPTACAGASGSVSLSVKAFRAGGFTDMRAIPVVRIFALNAVLAMALTVFVDYAFGHPKARYGRDESGFRLFNS